MMDGAAVEEAIRRARASGTHETARALPRAHDRASTAPPPDQSGHFGFKTEGKLQTQLGASTMAKGETTGSPSSRSPILPWLYIIVSTFLTPLLFFAAAYSETPEKLQFMGLQNLLIPENWYAPIMIIIVALFAEMYEVGMYENLLAPINVGTAFGLNLLSIQAGGLIVVWKFGVGYTSFIILLFWLIFGTYAGYIIAKTRWERVSMSSPK
jgi:hypothetical protein